MADALAQLDQSLAAVNDMLHNLSLDIEKAPAFKRTPACKWFADRVSARQDLLRKRDWLRDQIRRQEVSRSLDRLDQDNPVGDIADSFPFVF
jgi:hypothetical protein